MNVEIRSNRFKEYIRLPADPYEIRDMLDRLRLYENSTADCKVIKCGRVRQLEGIEFRDTDVYLLNQLAKRIAQLDIRTTQDTQMNALIKADRDRSIPELIKMTYTDHVPTYPCSTYAELGEIAIENGWIDELEDVPDEAMPFIDLMAVGKAFAERDGGIFVDGCYCMPSSYEEPDMEITPDKPDPSFFRLLIAPKGSEAVKEGLWVSLPQEAGRIAEYASEHDIEIDDLAIYDFKSVLPKMKPPSMDIANAYVYQILANKLTDSLKYQGIVRLKAVMDTKPPMTPNQVNKLIEDLPRYEFLGYIGSADLYGYDYLDNNLPREFDIQKLTSVDMTEIGETLMELKGAHLTPYGLIGGIDQQLFAPVVKEQEQEETEDEQEDIAEDDEIQIGGITQ